MISNETLRPVHHKGGKGIKVFGAYYKPTTLFAKSVTDAEDETGWSFGAGDPEIFMYSDKLIVPGGQALDIGVGYGRSSLYLALRGMNVTAYDIDPNCVKVTRAIARTLDLPLEVKLKDITEENLGEEQYDLVLMAQTFIHFPSKDQAFSVMETAVRATKPGGYIWLRAAGKEDSSYQDKKNYPEWYPDVRVVDEDTYETFCDCSGEIKLEPILYLEPLETLSFFAQHKLRFIHTQVGPKFGQANIMYGEDWKRQQFYNKTSGIITILAQKPQL